MAGPGTLYQTGDHASRPANGAGCVLYSCTTHNLVYRDDGSSWTTFITLASGLSNPMTATGDIIYSSDGSGTPAALAAGSDGEVLTLASGIPSWAAAGGASVTFSDWTPTVTADVTNPTIASRTGRYATLGKLGIFSYLISFATGDNAGSGNWIVSLPAGWTANARAAIPSHVYDSGTRYYMGMGWIDSGGTTIARIVHSETGSNGRVAHNAPMTWADGDALFGTGVLELQ